MKEKILQKFGEVFGDTTGVKTYFAPGRVNLIGSIRIITADMYSPVR